MACYTQKCKIFKKIFYVGCISFKNRNKVSTSLRFKVIVICAQNSFGLILGQFFNFFALKKPMESKKKQIYHMYDACFTAV